MISRIHHDGKMISVVIWDTRLGNTNGFYRGYFGFIDPRKPLLTDDFVTEKDLVRMKSKTVAPGLNMNIVLYGFDTGYIDYYNIGPEGQDGHGSVGKSHNVWHTERVFESLDEMSDEAMAL